MSGGFRRRGLGRCALAGVGVRTGSGLVRPLRRARRRRLRRGSAIRARGARGRRAPRRARRRPRAAWERHRPVTAGEESFTAARHHMIRSMTSTQVTASSSLGSAGRRGRRLRRCAAAHPERPCTAAALRTHTESPPQVRARLRDQADHYRETPGHRVRPRLLLAAAQPGPLRKEELAPHKRAADRGTARPPCHDTRAETMLPRHKEQTSGHTRNTRTGTSQETRNAQTPWCCALRHPRRSESRKDIAHGHRNLH